ncbi:MAG: excinuclease ABC subunit UvrA [Prevotellaceae bacterium]|jgi:excinuclease ABC subunit A|nr:excinuclease ABC subunit UvrA [Prevotellaceae bacterium]
MEESKIEVIGARVHNLKNVNVTIPRNALTVITGLSGSGKSSLAFDTIYAEGQRRYMETLSAYARQFVGSMERPDVEQITGLSPVISIEQKTTSKNPRSTVGTTTEIYDFLRLLFARAGIAYSKNTGEQMVRYTDEQIANLITEKFAGQKLLVLAPIVKGRKGHYKELFDQLGRKGYLSVRVDGEVREIRQGMKLDRYKPHFVELVVDKVVPGDKDDDRKRLYDAIATAMQQGGNTMMALNIATQEVRYYSRHLMCPTTGIAYNEPAPHTFSFNSPQGACPRCNGLGVVAEADVDKIIPNRKMSIRSGGIAPLGAQKSTLLFAQIEAIAKKFGFLLSDPIESIPAEGLEAVLYGTQEGLRIDGSKIGVASSYLLNFEGVVSIIGSRHEQDDDLSPSLASRYISHKTCPVCHGMRLKEEALFFKIADKNIAELSAMDVEALSAWFGTVEQQLAKRQRAIAAEIVKEIRSRLSFLLDVGLGYLSLNRSSASLSGGESQRIRLATQIGSKLVNVLYILDEPSIGLHQRDNIRLIASLKRLRDEGNSVIVVEHDEEMIRAADWVVDVGPGAGVRGGKIIFQGKIGEQTLLPTNAAANDGSGEAASLTLQYLRGEKKIPVPATRRKGLGKSIVLKGATGNNLKNVTLELPLGKFICVTGVSGSGKSTLINETLHPILSRRFYRSLQNPLPYKEITGVEHIDKIVEVDQSPIGRTPRSNPATYTGVFGEIRKLFEATPDAKIRGYKAGRFSFNVKGGRCEECRGAGTQTIEMNFLPDVYVTCKTCNGKRYNRETLAVRYKGKNISDVLEMTIDQAAVFFESVPNIFRSLKAMQSVGLGYITLGQSGTTLSGGESQRLKLSAELAKRDTGQTLYTFDEPTTGLHFEDVRVLLEVLNKLVERGNTIVVIEHNMDVIKVADHIIDLGPEGGAGGGKILCAGTPEEICKSKKSYTAQLLKEILNSKF